MSENTKERVPESVKQTLSMYNKTNGKHYEIEARLYPSSPDAFFAIGTAVYIITENPDTDNAVRYAAKFIDGSIREESTPGQTENYFRREIECMKKYTSPYTIRLVDSFSTCFNYLDGNSVGTTTVYMHITPLLVPAIKKCEDEGYSLECMKKLFYEIGEALKILHKDGYIHRDIKIANCLYDPETDRFILADFGISRETTVDGVTRVGTDENIPPEVFLRLPLFGRVNIDIYGLGAMLVNYNAEFRPFNGPVDYTKRLGEIGDADFSEMICKALHNDPAVRFQTIDEFRAEFNKYYDRVTKRNEAALASQSSVKVLDAYKSGKRKEALRLAQEAKGLSDTAAILYAYLLGRVNKDYSAASAVLKPLARKGSAAAAGICAIMTGTGKTDNSLLVKSADGGFPVAQYLVGRWMMTGENGFTKDYAKGIALLAEAMNQNFCPAKAFWVRHLIRQGKPNDEGEITRAKIDLDRQQYPWRREEEGDLGAEVIAAILRFSEKKN